MPYSTAFLKSEVKEHILSNIDKKAEILDAGAGCGTYADLLRQDYPNMDAVEIHARYIKQFDLPNKYRNVFLGNIMQFNFEPYDFIIFGDIIEHLSVADAQKLLWGVHESGKRFLVGVPYQYEQGEWEGNVYEIHLQPDLTIDVFISRYPFMKLLFGDKNYGYFVNYDFF
jgi:hypothetical protein